MPKEEQDDFPEDDIEKLEVEMSAVDLMFAMKIMSVAETHCNSTGNYQLAEYSARLHSMFMEEVCEQSYLDMVEQENDVKEEWMKDNLDNLQTMGMMFDNDSVRNSPGFQ